MKGKPGVLEVVRHIYELAAASDVEIAVAWVPRESEEMQLTTTAARMPPAFCSSRDLLSS